MVTGAAVSELVQKGNIIASGLSFGIDALAHEATLQCKGVTYAFVPCGLHTTQPTSHVALMEQIADTGAVITPYVFGKEALPFRFIGRNTILASWCDTLLVIEARSKGGTMNPERSALKKGKRVLAVPNSLLEPISLYPKEPKPIPTIDCIWVDKQTKILSWVLLLSKVDRPSLKPYVLARSAQLNLLRWYKTKISLSWNALPIWSLQTRLCFALTASGICGEGFTFMPRRKREDAPQTIHRVAHQVGK